MVDSPAHGCLEPEVLSAYVDHGLSLAERARVEAHLASCPRCTMLLAGVVRTVAELGPDARDADTPVSTPAVSWRAVINASAAAAAVIGVLATPAVLRPWLDYDAELVSLAGSAGEHRSVLGRLSGGFPHAPLPAPSAGGQDAQATTGTDRVLLASGRIRESFGELHTASQLHATGVASLLAREYDIAARLLLAAFREQPANARYLNDLATVQLERARLGLRPDDLPRALASAERATRLDPNMREAWFNRALAINALSLTDQAKAAWTEYLKRDSASPWASEARQRLDELMRPTPAAAWEGIEARLEQSLDAATADAAVRAQGTEARNYLENELFVEWANAVLSGADGAAELDRLRVMADAMLRVTGDSLYRDAVAAIDGRSPSAAGVLAHAHRTYAEAAAVFRSDRFDEAAPRLQSAAQAFAAANSPFAVRAAIDIAATEYYSSRYSDALNRLQAAAAIADSKAYPWIRGHVSWIEGLIAFAQGRIGDAQALYEETLATFERMGDAEQTVGAHNLLMGLHYYLGNKPEEWRHRQRAFEKLSVSRSARLRFRTYLAAAASVRFENPETALLLQEQALQALTGSGLSAAAVEVLASRAHTLISLGRLPEAAGVIAEARQNFARVTGPLREVFELIILSPESELQRQHDPAAAVATAQRALELIARRNNPADRSRLPRFNLQLAKANMLLRDLAGADRALTDGIRAFESERAAVTDEGRFSVVDENWELFETGMELAIRVGDLERAFALSERARARTLAEARRTRALRPLGQLQAKLDHDVALIALNQFEHQLAVWLIRRDSVRVIMRPLTRLDAARLVGRQQEEVWRESASTPAGRDLYSEVVRPLMPALRGAKRITFVPDGTYENVAFAALWDATRQRFLIEDVTVSVAPSVELYVSAIASGSAYTSEQLLVVGPAEQLSQRVNDVASLYRSATVLTGASATSSRFLNDAPNYGIVHVAAHTAPNHHHPLLSRLILSDEGGRRYTGGVLGRDIAGRPMPATKLVVLDELRANPDQRGEGTLKLARAFMSAGVPAVIGTLPGADERVVRDLLIGFHREMMANIPAGQALSRVQRNALQQNGRRLGAWTALVIYGSDR